MAKRIKVKGKPPRGLSKSQRIKIAPLQRKRNEIINSERKRADPGDVSESTLDAIDRYDSMIDEIAERPDIASRPSSTRKKRVKEGNRKFIGPREQEEFNEWDEFESPTGYHPRNRHTDARGFRKAARRAEMRAYEDEARARGNERLDRYDAEILKSKIASNASSREGRLLNKLLKILKNREDDRIPF